MFAPWNLSSLFSVVFLLHCSDCTQTHSIVAQLLEQGAPVIKWTTLYEKERDLGQKPQRNGFFGVFTHYCTKSLAILLQCSDDTQTYRIVDHFTLKGGKTKIEPQNKSQFLFTTSEISRVGRSWFSIRENLALFSVVFLLHCFDCTQAQSIVAHLLEQGAPVI